MFKQIIVPAMAVLLAGTSLITAISLAEAQSVSNLSQSTDVADNDRGLNEHIQIASTDGDDDRNDSDDHDNDRDDDDGDDDGDSDDSD